MEKRRILTGILLVVIGIFVTSNIYTLIPLYPEIGKAMGIPAKEAGYGSTAFTLFYACGLLLCGPLSDRAGRKKVMVAGLFLSAFTTFFVSLAQNPAQLYLFRGLQGFTLASFAPAAFSYSFELFRDRERPFWLALTTRGSSARACSAKSPVSLWRITADGRPSTYFSASPTASLHF
jgi:MFS family permease